MTTKSPAQLSKSDYLLYLKHPAWLWLKKHQPSALPKTNDNLQAVFDQGTLFESIVEQSFAGLTRLGFDGYQEYRQLTARTKQKISFGDKLISQARFESGELTCVCDIIEMIDDRRLDLIEIKSSTSVKAEHIDDLAFQLVVLESAGYSVREISVIYVNNSYVRAGEIDPAQIYSREDVTEQVRARKSTTEQQIKLALAVMKQVERPSLSPSRASGAGLHEWLDIYESLQPSKEKYSIYKLARLSPQLVREFEARQITKITEVPADIELKTVQNNQIKATIAGKPSIDSDKIQAFLDQLIYPLYFIDYETLASVVPPFDGLKPYQQLPFQYSLHVLDAPNTSLRHLEYLHESGDNPGPALLAHMQRDIGPTGSVLVWYEGFEKGRNDEMAQLWPEFADFLHDINDRVVDLMKPFSLGYYVDRDFFGSASIKNVLPVLVPEKNHKDLAVSDGASAQRLWMQTVLGSADTDKAKVMADLRDYCELDTLAMVEIYQFLLKTVSDSTPSAIQQSLF